MGLDGMDFGLQGVLEEERVYGLRMYMAIG